MSNLRLKMGKPVKELSIGAVAVVLFITFCISPASGIVWGVLDNGKHPNVGTILYVWQGQAYQLGSGTLIHEKVFLTAGHVTNYLNRMINLGMITTEDVYVSFDSDNAFTISTWLHITHVITHPKYSGFPGASHHRYDIGALMLSAPVGLVPANLPALGFLDELKAAGELRGGPKREKFVVVGYGSSLEWPPPQYVPSDGARYMAESGYLAKNASWLFMSQNHAVGNGGTGYGDSGGPTFWNDSNGEEILVSITSWGDPNLVATGISYRIDTAKALAFIFGVIDDF
ncbi:hypothetical protein ES703_79277 [subsurface metagenome]